MAKKKSKSHTIEELSADSRRFIDVLGKETDRGAALAAAAFCDDALKSMLRAAMVDKPAIAAKVLNYPGPLSDFASRTDLAFLLGLIGEKIYRALHALREIRNQFAHSHDLVAFSSEGISPLVEKVKVVVWDFGFMSPRNTFVIQASLLVGQLLLNGLAVKHRDQHEDFKEMGPIHM